MYYKQRFLLLMAMMYGLSTQATVLDTVKKHMQLHPFAYGITVSLAGLTATALYGMKYKSTEKGAATLATSKIHWNWDEIERENPDFFAHPEGYFPKNFVWGAGTSYLQIEGAAENTDWFHTQFNQDGTLRQEVEHPIGQACDSWNRWREDIDAAAAFGLNQYRLSIDRSKVEPQPGVFDQNAIDRYKEMINYIRSKGMTELIGLHHYTDPQWFAQIGGFNDEKNIQGFVDFCTRMTQEIGHAPGRLWATFNSPTGYVFAGTQTGTRPPYIKNDLQRTMNTLKNVLEAHVQVYQAAKKINPALQIGILKNIMHLDPWREGHKLDMMTVNMGNTLQNDVIFNFFTTGRFEVDMPLALDLADKWWVPQFIKDTWKKIPYYACVKHVNEKAPESLDFIGINHYSHIYMKNSTKITPPFEVQTQNSNYTVYPEGMYRAVKLIFERMVEPIKTKTGKEVPVYITENGIAHDDPQVRLNFFQRTMYAIKKAIDDGYPVQGYTYWSLLDNYEWGSYNKKYGLVHVDFPIGGNGTLDRTIKTDAGTTWFRNLVTNYKRSKVGQGN